MKTQQEVERLEEVANANVQRYRIEAGRDLEWTRKLQAVFEAVNIVYHDMPHREVSSKRMM